jgi:hypothetical protein
VSRPARKNRLKRGKEKGTYPLVNVYIAMENHYFLWENPLLMAIFNSYVKLQEGKSRNSIWYLEVY